jgi:hypothetical protein
MQADPLRIPDLLSSGSAGPDASHPKAPEIASRQAWAGNAQAEASQHG